MLITRRSPWLTRCVHLVSIAVLIVGLVPATGASGSAGVAIHWSATEGGKAAAPRQNLGAPAGRAPFVVQPDINDRPLLNGAIITATKRDSLLVDNDGDTFADPGDVLLYTVVISNTGSTATGVVFTDTIDANTTLSGTVQTTPLALNDTYTATGNVRISVTGGINVLANDSDPDGSGAVTVITYSVSSAQGGNVSVSANGDFTYDPPAGYEGVDTFTYTIQDVDGNQDVGTVTVTISGMIWFINATAGACVSSCDGRLTHPFTTLGAFNAVNDDTGNHPAAGDNIFLYESLTSYTNGVTLLNNQKLIGQDSTSPTLAALTGVTPPSYSDPLPPLNGGTPPTTNLTNSGGDGVALASGNSLNGFTAGIASGVAITGTNFGTLTVNDVIINNTSSSALSLNNGTANTTFTSVTSIGGSSNIRLAAVAGTLNLGSGSLSGSSDSGAAFRILTSGSTATVNYSGSISKTTANFIVDIDNHATGTVTLSGNLTCNTLCTGIDVSSNSSGTVLFSGTKTLNTGANAAVTLSSNTGATIEFTGGGLDIDTTSGRGITATVGGTINVTGAGNTINTTTGQAVVMNSVSVGASHMTFATIGVSGSPSADALSFTSVSGPGTFNGGDVTVAGTTSGDGIEINGSAATFNFTSATIDNTAGAGLNLSGANGTVTFTTVDIDGTTGAGIDISSNTNAVNVNGGTLGATNDPAGNVVDVSAGSANVTLIANLTKSTAGRIVEITGRTGTATVGISGSLNCSSGCTGLNVQNNTSGTTTINFSNGTKNLSTGGNTAVTLDNNDNATINFSNGGLNIDTTSGMGFNAINGAVGVNVTGSGNTIDSTTGTALNFASTTIGASGLTFQSISSSGATNGIVLNTTGTSGSLTVSGTGSANSGGTIQNSTGDGIVLTSTDSPSLNWMNVTDSAGGASDDGIVMTNVTGNVTVANSTIANSPHNGVTVDNNNTNMASFSVTNSTISCASGQPCQPSGAIGNDGLLLSMRGTSILTSGIISGSTISGVRAVGVQVQTNDTGRIGSNSGGSILSSFTIQNNTFTGNGQGIDVDESQISNLTFQILNNTINGIVTAPGVGTPLSSAVAINAFTTAGADTGPTSHTFVGKIDGNIIGTAGVKDSGSGFGSGIRVVVQGSATQGIVTVSNNTIREVANADILFFVGQNGAASSPSASARFKIINNLMPAPSGSNLDVCGPVDTACASNGIFVLADEGSAVCNIMTGNNIYDVTTMLGSFDIFLAERAGPPAGAQLTVEGTGGSNSAYIQANNTLAGGSKYIDEGANTSQVALGACGTFPMLAAGGEAPRRASSTPLNVADLSSLKAQAIAYWSAAGISASEVALLRAATLTLADLPAGHLGEADVTANTIRLDPTAAGWGWFVDATPGNNASEFRQTTLTEFHAVVGSPAAGRMDLLTTVMHEMGHLLGRSDLHDLGHAHDLMAGSLLLGTRRLPAGVPSVIYPTQIGVGRVGLARPVISPLFSGENISITIGTLPAGEIITVTFAVTISNPLTSPPTATSVSNQGTVTWDGGGSTVTDDPDTGTPGDPTVTTLDLEADLALTKDDGGITVQPGNLITYTLVYTNAGPNPAPTVTLTETVPTNTTYTDTGAGWTCLPNNNPGSTCTKNVGSLAMSAGGSITFTLTVTNPVPAGVTTITNTATIGSNIPDPVPGNNTALDTTPVDAEPDLQITKSDGGITTTPGSTITYTLNFTNTGNQGATGVVLTETVPANTEYPTGGWSCSGVTPGSVCTMNIGALLGGGGSGTATFAVTVTNTVPAGVDTITNTASIGDDGSNGADPNTGDNTAIDTTPLNAKPNFQITKSDGGITTTPGAVLTYTINYTNTGDQNATGVVLTETVPANTTFAGSGWTGCTSGSPAGTVCTKSVGSLAGLSNGFGTATFVVTVTNPIPAGVNFIGNIAGIGDDGSNGADPTPNAIDTTPVDAAPDLQIVKSDGGIRGTPGSVIQYTLTFTNTGDQGATGIVLSDTVPANSTFKPASSHPNWVCSPNNNPGSVCTITPTLSLAGGNASSVITFALQVDNPFPLSEPSITNTVTIGDDGANGADATPANNTSTDVTPIDNLPDLKLTKSDGDISVLPGGVITYTITYTNLGGLDAPNAVITETVPDYTTYIGDLSWTCTPDESAGSICTQSVGTVPGQDSGSVEFVVQVDDPIATGVDKITNTASIADDGSNGADPNTGNNTATDNTPVDAAPDLVLIKDDGDVTVMPGDMITYVLYFENSSFFSNPQGATGVVITDTVPANTTYTDTGEGWSCSDGAPAGSVCTLTIGSLEIDDSGFVLFVVTVTDTVLAGVVEITNTASIGDDGDNGEDLDSSDNEASDFTPLDAAPDLVVIKDDGGITAVPGDTITYTVTFANLGNQEATSVVLTETVPANTTFTGIGWTCTPDITAGSVCTLSVGDLEAGFGGSEVFVVTTAISMPAGVAAITNTVSIGDDGTQGADLDDSDNTDTDTTPVDAAPDLQVTKDDGGITATASSPITYTVTYTNTGNQGATGVVLTETVPANTTALSGAGWSCASGTCTFSVGPLAAGVSGSTTFTVTVAGSVPAGVDFITNTVKIGNDGANGADQISTTDNIYTTTTPLNAAPDLRVTKTDGGVTKTPGSVLTYTVTYTNTGTQGATGVVLTETVPANTTFSGSGWTGCVSGSPAGTVCTKSIGGLAVNSTGSTSFVVTIASSVAADVTTITNTVSIGDDGANGADLNSADNTGMDTTPLNAAPDLKITKSHGSLIATPGSFIAYTLFYTNTGTQDAIGVVITDVVPANTTFNSSTPSSSCSLGAPAGTVCTFTLGNLAAGSSGTPINYTVLVNLSTPAGVTTITNTATIGDNGSQGADLNPANNSSTDTTPLLRPDLALTKSDGGASAKPNAVITYTLTYSNIGTWQSNGVVITDTVPANTTFETTGSSPGWSCADGAPAGSVCTISIGTVLTGTGGTRIFAITLNNPLPPGTTTITNTATIGDDGAYGVDNNPTNNTATDTTPTFFKISLPVMMKSFSTAPDLVVTQLLASSNAITVTIQNIGNAPTANSFWVDVYINPSPPPTQVNQLWSDLGTQGLVWGVTTTISPNGILTLTIGGPYYSAADSNFSGSLTPGTPVYAQVDSFNASTTYGAVRENHEIGGGAYNNITGPVSSTLSVLSSGAPATTPTEPATGDDIPGLTPLPPRYSHQVNRRRP